MRKSGRERRKRESGVITGCDATSGPRFPTQQAPFTSVMCPPHKCMWHTTARALKQCTCMCMCTTRAAHCAGRTCCSATGHGRPMPPAAPPCHRSGIVPQQWDGVSYPLPGQVSPFARCRYAMAALSRPFRQQLAQPCVNPCQPRVEHHPAKLPAKAHASQ